MAVDYAFRYARLGGFASEVFGLDIEQEIKNLGVPTLFNAE